MPTAHFTRTFSAAHRVWNDPGKCNNIHGHNYRVDVEVTVDLLNIQNFAVPFDAIKKVIDRFDHVLILDEDDPFASVFDAQMGPFESLAVAFVAGVPSTEFVAALLAERIYHAVLAEGADPDQDVMVDVTLRETDSIAARVIFP